MNNLTDIFGPPVYVYTRAQALADGVLVDVSNVAKEAGLAMHTAVTSAVWDEYIQAPKNMPGQDESGRCWDVVWMLSVAIRSGQLKGDTGIFELIVATPDSVPLRANEIRESRTHRLVKLKAICGPGDNGEPVLTILRPEED